MSELDRNKVKENGNRWKEGEDARIIIALIMSGVSLIMLVVSAFVLLDV